MIWAIVRMGRADIWAESFSGMNKSWVGRFQLVPLVLWKSKDGEKNAKENEISVFFTPSVRGLGLSLPYPSFLTNKMERVTSVSENRQEIKVGIDIHTFISVVQLCPTIYGPMYCNTPGFPAAAAKSLWSCPTLCDPMDGSPPGFSIPGILQARTLEWVAISFSNACMHAKLLQLCRTLCNP